MEGESSVSVWPAEEPHVDNSAMILGEAEFAEVENLEFHTWTNLEGCFVFDSREKANENTLYFQCVMCQHKKTTIKGQVRSLHNLVCEDNHLISETSPCEIVLTPTH